MTAERLLQPIGNEPVTIKRSRPFGRQFLASLLISPVLSTGLASGAFRASNAQQIDEDWSPVVRRESDGYTRWTKIVSGADNRMHAFWAAAEPADERGPYTSRYKTIFYASSTDGLNWSQPSDIVFDTFGIDDLDVVPTDNGLHLFWNSDCVRLVSTRYGDNAQDAKNWVGPEVCVAARAIPDSLAAVKANASDKLVLLFSSGETLNMQVSTDDGISWSPSLPIADARESGDAANTAYPSAFVNSQGSLFVTWSAVKPSSDNFEITGVFFAQSDDLGETWTTPTLLAGPGNTEPAIVVRNDDEVHVIWNTLVAMSMRFHVWSANRGQTWSDVDDILNANPYGASAGKQGAPAIIVDDDKTVGVLVGTNAGVRYSQWRDKAWTQALHLGSVEDGETWSTGLVTHGSSRLCAYWNAYDAPSRGFSISCKGLPPDKSAIDNVRLDVQTEETAGKDSQAAGSEIADLNKSSRDSELTGSSSPQQPQESARISRSAPSGMNELTPVLRGAGLSLLLVASVVITIALRTRRH